MSLRIGSEVQAYQHVKAPSGVPRVMNETHRYLDRLLTARDMDLVPILTRGSSGPAPGQASSFLANDPVMAKRRYDLHEVDALLLLEPTPMTDYARILRLRREGKVPVVAMIHDLLPLQRPEWFQAGADRHYRVLLQQVMHVADHVIVPSRAVKSDVLDLGWRIRPSVHVVHLGSCLPQRPPRRNPKGRLDMVYVSTLAPRKGHEQLLRAFDLLRAENEDVRLFLVGSIGWCVDELVSTIRTHPDFGAALQWVEQGDDALVANLVGESTVAVIPAEGEGFGLFLEEALSCGLPVVATDLPVFRERANPNVIYVDPTVESLVNGLREAAGSDPDPLGENDIRKMTDFAEDLAEILDVVLHDSLQS